MKNLLLLSLIAILSAPVVAEEFGDLGGSLRSHDLDSQAATAELKNFPKEHEGLQLDYVQQPPLIPHSIRGYQVNKNSNKCLSCHSFKNYKKYGATKISITHFKNRDGVELTDVSPRRYFCQQCHVPQVEAPPLVENTFEPAGAAGE